MKPDKQNSLLQDLANPPREFTPVPFWFLNDDLSHAEIRRQLRAFRDHGVYGVVPHPRMGLSDRIAYLSPTFFSYIRTVVETAADLGMQVILYDEGMYPSGSAGGLIVRENPDLASRGLGLTRTPEPGDRVLAETDNGFLVERFSGGTIRGVHFGEDDGERRCAYVGPQGDHCRNLARPGSDYCGIHEHHHGIEDPSAAESETQGE